MRALLLLALLVVPMATTARPVPVEVVPSVEVAEDCGTCVEADLTVTQAYPDNCADCGGVGAHVGVAFDGEDVHADATVCRGGIVVICPVDERVVL